MTDIPTSKFQKCYSYWLKGGDWHCKFQNNLSSIRPTLVLFQGDSWQKGQSTCGCLTLQCHPKQKPESTNWWRSQRNLPGTQGELLKSSTNELHTRALWSVTRCSTAPSDWDLRSVLLSLWNTSPTIIWQVNLPLPLKIQNKHINKKHFQISFPEITFLPV